MIDAGSSTSAESLADAKSAAARSAASKKILRTNTNIGPDLLQKVTKGSPQKVSKILLTHARPEGPKSPYSEFKEKYKVAVDFIPFITVEGVPGKEFRKQRIVLNEFSGVIFTSRNAIDHFFRICEELKVKMSQETKYFCTSEAIALYLQKYTQYRKRKVFIEEANTGKDLAYHLSKHKDTTRFLYICADVRKDEIPSYMRANHFNYSEAVMYKTVPVDLKSSNIFSYDLIVFFSPSAIVSLLHNYPEFKQNNIRFASFGNATTEALLEAGLNVHLVAPVEGAPSIVVALKNYLRDNNK